MGVGGEQGLGSAGRPPPVTPACHVLRWPCRTATFGGESADGLKPTEKQESANSDSRRPPWCVSSGVLAGVASSEGGHAAVGGGGEDARGGAQEHLGKHHSIPETPGPGEGAKLPGRVHKLPLLNQRRKTRAGRGGRVR